MTTKMDRFGRSLSQVLVTLEKLKAQGVTLICTDQPVDTSKDDPMSNAMTQLLGLFAEMERNFIITRTQEGKAISGNYGGRPSKLNTEQQQRLCLARTLTLNPRIILMDKPTASLNSSSKAHFENLILDLKNDYTIIIACEEKQQAGRIGNKVAFFFKYNLIEMGETKKVFVQPKELLTENYITGRIS